MNQLQVNEFDELNQFDTEEKTVFVIKDLEGLNWAFRKLNAIQAAIKEKKQLADAEKQRIDEWYKKSTAPLEMDVEYFENLITQYHAQVLLDDPKQKSISTPYGKVKSTTSKAQPEKKDEQALLHYVKANELPFVEVKESLKWGDLKKKLTVIENDLGSYVVDENGEIVPGVEVKPMQVTHKVEVSE